MSHPYWRNLAIAKHEAAHAIAAQTMGLKVAWVSIEDVMSEGEIYKAATGIEIEGHEDDQMKVAMDLDLTGHPKLLEVCVTTAMPAFTTNPSDSFYGYSVFEYRQAIQKAEKGGIASDEIDFRCEAIADERWSEILDLARQLVHYGRVEF
jgi:hypothetical protein